MKLELNHTQRINLHALLGTQRGDLTSIRSLWNIQDKIALTSEEENTIELRRELVGGQELVVWNPTLSLPTKEFEFTEGERLRVQFAVETWDRYNAATDRHWLEPLIAKFLVNES